MKPVSSSAIRSTLPNSPVNLLGLQSKKFCADSFQLLHAFWLEIRLKLFETYVSRCNESTIGILWKHGLQAQSIPIGFTTSKLWPSLPYIETNCFGGIPREEFPAVLKFFTFYACSSFVCRFKLSATTFGLTHCPLKFSCNPTLILLKYFEHAGIVTTKLGNSTKYKGVRLRNWN